MSSSLIVCCRVLLFWDINNSTTYFLLHLYSIPGILSSTLYTPVSFGTCNLIFESHAAIVKNRAALCCKPLEGCQAFWFRDSLATMKDHLPRCSIAVTSLLLLLITKSVQLCHRTQLGSYTCVHMHACKLIYTNTCRSCTKIIYLLAGYNMCKWWQNLYLEHWYWKVLHVTCLQSCCCHSTMMGSLNSVATHHDTASYIVVC